MFALTLAAVLLGAADDAAQSDFAYEPPQTDGAVVATIEKDRAVFLITDSRGIGGITIAPKDKKWPKFVVFRLRYSAEGNGFKSLEEFRLKSPHIGINGSLNPAGTMNAIYPDDENKSVPIKVTTAVKDQFLEICLPADTLTGTEKATLRWIDAYRR